MKKIFIALLMIFCLNNLAFANESQDVTNLSLQDCLNIALNNHPSLKKSKGAVKSAQALIEQTKSTNRVKVSATARTGLNGDYQYWDDRYHSGALSLTASKTLYDTNVNKLNIEIQNENLQGVLESER